MPRKRPALDITVPSTATGDQVEAFVLDFGPYAITESESSTTTCRPLHRRVYFSTDHDRDAAARKIPEAFGADGVTVTPVDVVDDGAFWVKRSQESLPAIRVGRVVVAPPWDLPVTAPDDVLVVIRPSLGFGTGHHPSTRLCLLALQAQTLSSRTVTDLGTGSGVLAIAAARLGARSVLALDHDRDALTAAQENLLVNAVDTLVTLRHADVQTMPLPPRTDVVMANLTAAMLVRHADTVAGCAAPGGTLILGGLTAGEEAEVTTAFAPWAGSPAERQADGWACLVLTTHPDSGAQGARPGSTR